MTATEKELSDLLEQSLQLNEDYHRLCKQFASYIPLFALIFFVLGRVFC